jgi:Outer membrane protein beta-barrel domain
MRCALLALVFFLPFSSAFAQQEYVPRYELYTGFSYLNSPALNLAERGFNGEFGVNLNHWLTIGGDFSVFTGHSDITPQELTPALQQQLARVIPPGVPVSLPFDSTTFTFAAGPQFSLRKFKWVTLFARPGFGGLHETATLKPNTPLTAALVAQLVPGGKKSDLEPFYGAGGGFEVNASRHVGMYVSLDYVYVKLFDGFLANGRNSLRVSVGPTFRFGPDVK